MILFKKMTDYKLTNPKKSGSSCKYKRSRFFRIFLLGAFIDIPSLF